MVHTFFCACTLAEPTTPTRDGYTFDGWYKEAGLTNKITFTYTMMMKLAKP